jgi:diamine N-acetyltransferase
MLDNTIQIRQADLADAAPLAAFAEHSFCATYAADNDPNNMRMHVEQRFGVAQQAAELRNPEMISLVAQRDNAMLGFAQIRRCVAPENVISHVQSELPANSPSTVIELHRFYVDQSAHGTGLAQRLMQAALQSALSQWAGQFLWLSVWEQNPRAIAFYQKLGFVDVGTGFYIVGKDRQVDRIMLGRIADLIS